MKRAGIREEERAGMTGEGEERGSGGDWNDNYIKKNAECDSSLLTYGEK
jgi:hypothetical protein